MERLFLTCDLTRIHLDALLTIGQHLSEAAATLLPEGVATAPVAELDEALEALGLAMRQPQTKRGATNRLAADLAVEETWRAAGRLPDRSWQAGEIRTAARPDGPAG